MKLGKTFGNLVRYAQLFRQSYEVRQLRRGGSDLRYFTPGHLHPDYATLPSFAPAASGSGSGRKRKKYSKPPSPQQVASLAAPHIEKGPPSLPGAQRRFFTPRQTPAPYPNAHTIAATFHERATQVLRESNCLFPLSFSPSVHIRGAPSLTVTDKATLAASYTPYFDSLTRTLNQSFPVGENP